MQCRCKKDAARDAKERKPRHKTSGVTVWDAEQENGGVAVRDPQRIEPMMDEMAALWKEKVPDWRFGQLMSNFFLTTGDPFYYEDDVLLEKFRKYMGEK